MTWTIEYTGEARRLLRQLDRQTAKRIRDFLQNRLAQSEDPRRFGKPLTGHLSGLWRYRVGDYRIICKIEDDCLVVLVIRVGHRRKVYRS